MAVRGVFITIEGADGVGKSTQASRLASALRDAGKTVVETREPGGSVNAEAIRKLVLTGAQGSWTPMAEALLMYASRAEHLEHLIKPALARGDIIVCDRFSDSTRAYQAAAGALGADAAEVLDRLVVGDMQPNLTVLLDLSVEEARARATGRDQNKSGAVDYFEQKSRDYHERVAAAFRELADRFPERIVRINAGKAEDEVFALIWETVSNRLALSDS
ncbi:MAG: dTMP kinase [Pseudomonadota bacterium]